MKKTLIPIALVFALVAVAPAAFAATNTSNLTVNASVAANCTIANATLNFLAYDPIVTNAVASLDASTTMTVACTKGIIPTIGLATGARTITNGTDTLTYDLYKDVAGGTVWGDTGSALFMPPSQPGKGGTPYTIFGRIPGGQNPSAGAYNGTITATVNF